MLRIDNKTKSAIINKTFWQLDITFCEETSGFLQFYNRFEVETV